MKISLCHHSMHPTLKLRLRTTTIYHKNPLITGYGVFLQNHIPPYWAISRPHLYLLMKLSLLALFFVWNEEQRHDTYRSQLARSDHRYYIVSMLWSVCVYNCLIRPRGLHELTAPLCSGDSSLWSAVPLSWSLDGECGHVASSSPWAGRERWVTHVSIHIERLTIFGTIQHK